MCCSLKHPCGLLLQRMFDCLQTGRCNRYQTPRCRCKSGHGTYVLARTWHCTDSTIPKWTRLDSPENRGVITILGRISNPLLTTISLTAVPMIGYTSYFCVACEIFHSSAFRASTIADRTVLTHALSLPSSAAANGGALAPRRPQRPSRAGLRHIREMNDLDSILIEF